MCAFIVGVVPGEIYLDVWGQRKSRNEERRTRVRIHRDLQIAEIRESYCRKYSVRPVDYLVWMPPTTNR